MIRSENLRMLLQKIPRETIDNLRVQRLLGINRTDGKATMETIPSEKRNRSAFSCERYQFFLDSPFEIGQQCCRTMKKNPAHRYFRETGRRPITAQMASESRLRTQQWLRNGCNGFDLEVPISNPLSIWFKQDILAYAKYHNLRICNVYGDIVSDDEETGQMNLQDVFGTGVFDLERPELHTTGCQRTGCFACGFSIHHEDTKEKSRLQDILEFSNPKLLDWMLRGGHFRESDGMWEPYQGLGLAFVYEWINQHGGFNIWFPDKEKYLSKLPEECWRYLHK